MSIRNLSGSGEHSQNTSQSQLSQRLLNSISDISSRFGECAAENERMVYIRDPTYNWIPGRIMDDDDDIAASDGIHSIDISKKKHITLKVDLGDKWDATTVVDPKYKLTSQSTIKVNLSNDYAGNVLPLQNRDNKTGKPVSKSDLADLEHLHEAAMLYNLKERNVLKVPYLRVGDIIIATNPFAWIDGLYSEKQQSFYADRLIWSRAPTEKSIESEDEEDKKEEDDTNGNADGNGGGSSSISKNIYWFTKLNHEPHVYETSSMAYEGMLFHGRDQAVIVTGESGAGKTETVKIVLRHLATLPAHQAKKLKELTGGAQPQSIEEEEEEQPQEQSDVVTKVLQSNPVFEAFGNAKTLRNNNSSRFGKFTQLQFSTDIQSSNNLIPSCELVGTKCDTYLLEKSRVVSHDIGERGYHIFYQLLTGASSEEKCQYWEQLEHCDLHSFVYLSPHEGDKLPDTEDSDEELWNVTLKALALFNISGDVLKALIRTLCTVLQLGNLIFEDNPDSYDESSIVGNVEELDKLADVFGVDSETMLGVLTKRTIVTRGESILVTLNKETAKETCDAFAKEIYSQMFDWLVRQINQETEATTPDGSKQIRQAALLDIFGFEIFKVNRFEQLCINYANERIQQKYVSDVFNEVKTEYEREGIEVFDFSAVDNLPICELIEGRTGVVTVLNEECKRPKGNDASFVFKLKAVYKEDKFLIADLLHTPYQFGIRHFAGDVTYDSRHFVEKNMDTLPMDLIDCAMKCDNTILSAAFTKVKQEMTAPPEPPKGVFVRRAGPKPGKTTVLTKFKKQLRSLLTTISKSRTRYIRCIKPNALFLPGVMDHKMTITQLSSAGLITAVTISRETFPNTLTYELFLERFRCIAPSAQIDLPPDKLREQGIDLYQAKLKSLCNELLTILLQDQKKVVNNQLIYPFACGKSKVFFKSGALESLEVIRQAIYDDAALTIQKWARVIVYKAWYERMKVAVTKMQAWWRGASARWKLKKARRAVVFMQCCVRMVQARQELLRRKRNNAAIIIQTKWRTRSPVIQLRRFIKAAKVLRKAVRNRRNRGKMEYALHGIIEQAQRDHKLKALQLNLAITDENGLHKQPEKLLDQSQQMLDNLSSEVYKLRTEASSLKTELAVHKEKLDEHRMHSANSNAAHSAKRLESTRLLQYNKHLKTEIKSYKFENLQLKKSIKQMHEAQRQQITKQNELFKSMRTSHLSEIKKLRSDFLQTKQSYGKEIKKLERDLSIEKDKHTSNVKSLEEELQSTLDTHNDDLSRMFEALEATQRDDQTLKVVDEYLVTSSQEKQILELKKEVEDMKRKHAMEMQKLKTNS